jgi:hypothetical protein
VTQVKTPRPNIASVSDSLFETYVKALGEFKKLLPFEKDTKARPGVEVAGGVI